MEHKGTAQLETERLVLRKFTRADIPHAFANWTCDSRVTEYLRWPAHSDISVTERVVGGWIENYSDPSFYQWAIVLRQTGQPIGTISVVDMNDAAKKAHIGYCIGSQWWGQGITAEAFSAVIDFLFGEVGFQRIESMHDPENAASGRVMQKCGLVYEGTLRKSDWSNRGIVDAAMYAILADDYFSGKCRK